MYLFIHLSICFLYGDEIFGYLVPLGPFASSLAEPWSRSERCPSGQGTLRLQRAACMMHACMNKHVRDQC
jgi:hypothetical protein